MKRSLRASLFTAVIAMSVFSHNASAQDKITVGLQPVSVVPVGDKVHVFHNQVDANFNGQQDEGDSRASWWVLNTQGEKISSVELEWGMLGYPFRPYVDADNKVVYMSHLGRVRSFSLENQALLRDTVALYNAAGVAAHGDHVFVSMRPSFTDPGQFVVYNTTTNEETVRTVGVNPQQIVPFRTSDAAEGVLVLSEGGFGTTPPSLLDKHYFDGTTAPAALEIGGTGNYVFVQGDSAYVAMNTSYEVKIVNIKNWTVAGSIAVPTEPGNGPRELAVDGDRLFVSTFDNDVRLYSIASGELISTFDPTGRPEGIALVNGKLWVANAYESGSFTAANTVAVLNVSTTSIGEPSGLRPSIAPSVVSDEAVITLPFAVSARIEVISVAGEYMGEVRGDYSGGAYRARFVPAQYNLAAGRYFLRVTTGTVAYTVPVVVVR